MISFSAPLRIVTCLMVAITCQFATAQSSGGKKTPLTQVTALKLGPEKLTKYTNESEAGQDKAARLYATAKRIETESILAQKNLELVSELEEWRKRLRECRLGPTHLAYIINGGGTMYTHGGARDCAEVEDFLADVAKRLPMAAGKGDAKATKKMDDAITFIKKLKPLDVGDADAFKEAKTQLAEATKTVAEQWDGLKTMIGEIPAEDARKIATFVTGSLGWVKEEEEEKK